MSYSATVVIVHPTNPDLVLGVTRKHDHNDWGLPGGKIEPGEYADSACIRECFEETGVTVTSKTMLYSGTYRYDSDRVCTTFLALKYVGTPSACEDALVDWVPWSRLREGSFSAYNRHVFIAYQRHLGAELFYLQNTKSYAYDYMLFWAHNFSGYTYSLDDAGLYTRKEAESQCRSRPDEDVMWREADVVDVSNRAVSIELLRKHVSKPRAVL